MVRTAILVGIAWIIGASGALAQQEMDAMDDMMQTLSDVPAVQLTDSDIRRFIKTANELEALDIDELAGASSPAAVRALSGDDRAMAVLRANGFDFDEFNGVMWNVVLAMGAAEMQANQAEMDAARAQLEMMKDQMPAEQYAQLEAQMLGAFKMFEKATPENIALVRKYRDDIESIGED